MRTQEENSTDNPYQSPRSHVSAALNEPVGYEGKVYTSLAVAVGTLFGSVLAGGLLLHSNYSHFKQDYEAMVTILITIIATILFLFSSLFVEHPSSLLYLGANFLIAVFLMPLTNYLQGQSLEQHDNDNLPFHSVFRAAAIGIACLLAMGMMLTFAYWMFVIFAF